MARQKLRLPEVGDIWGNRVIIGEVYKNIITSKQYVKVECMDCGIVLDVRVDSGRGRSCTCVLAYNAVRKHGYTTHKYTGVHRLYSIWCGMKDRCKNDTHIGWMHYGGKGISVCDEWQMFIPFKDWSLCNGYENDLTIDRIDSNGNYEPTNCRWITQSENTLNSWK